MSLRYTENVSEELKETARAYLSKQSQLVARQAKNECKLVLPQVLQVQCQMCSVYAKDV